MRSSIVTFAGLILAIPTIWAVNEAVYYRFAPEALTATVVALAAAWIYAFVKAVRADARPAPEPANREFYGELLLTGAIRR